MFNSLMFRDSSPILAMLYQKTILSGEFMMKPWQGDASEYALLALCDEKPLITGVFSKQRAHNADDIS